MRAYAFNKGVAMATVFGKKSSNALRFAAPRGVARAAASVRPAPPCRPAAVDMAFIGDGAVEGDVAAGGSAGFTAELVKLLANLVRDAK
jgi:hypothetical protein